MQIHFLKFSFVRLIKDIKRVAFNVFNFFFALCMHNANITVKNQTQGGCNNYIRYIAFFIGNLLEDRKCNYLTTYNKCPGIVEYSTT